MGWSLAVTRAALEHRAVVVGGDREELLAGLAAPAHGTADRAGKVAFVFTGQGAQRPEMGRGLYRAYPAFAQAFDEVCAELEAHLGSSVAGVIEAGDGRLDETVWAQASLFAAGVALARLLASWGVTPDLVAGHSIGEVTAAYVAGVWSLADACRVVAARGRLMQALPVGGAMVAVQAGEEQVRQVLAGYPEVAVAAVNGPAAVVISGPERPVLRADAELSAAGARTRRLRVSHAFHSPLMDPMLAGFAEVMGAVTYREPRVPLVSALTGALASAELADPGYWVRHVREPVRFADAVAALRAAGVRTFLEVGPDRVLSAAGAGRVSRARRGCRCCAGAGTSRARPCWRWPGLTRAGCRRTGPDSTPGPGRGRVDLPGYAFQRQRYWLGGGVGRADAVGLGLSAAGHPLLGAAVDLPVTGGLMLTGRLSLAAQPWLADHVVAGQVLVPGTALAEMVVRAADEARCGRVRELVIEAPLVLPAGAACRFRLRWRRPTRRASAR